MRWTPWLLVAVFLAGCFGSAKPQAPASDGLHASATTGVLRGVVVDDAIRPLALVNITIRQGDVQRNLTTGSEGRFGFQDLPPGAYTVQAKRAHYSSAQQVVTVQAGLDDPPAARIQLAYQPGDLAFVTPFKLNGFMECSTPNVNACFIADFYPCFVQHTAGQACTGNLTSDRSSVTLYSVMDLRRTPDWTQAELVWTPTNDLFTQLLMRLDIEKPGSATIDASKSASGVSPLEVHANRTFAEKWKLGTDEGLVFETFGGGNPTACGLPSGLACSAAVNVNQDLTFYVHLFYGYTPPEGWRFSTDGTVPDPPA